MGAAIRKVVFSPPTPSYTGDGAQFDGDLTFIADEYGMLIPVLHVVPENHVRTILYSHGNAEDLGQIHLWAHELARHFAAQVISYDYRGYGPTKNGTATESNVRADVARVFSYLSDHVNKDEEVIIFGRSLGCAPSIALANRFPQQISALVLESPFLTCLKTVLHTRWTWWFDMFRNESDIASVDIPTMIVPGKLDRVVPFSHGTNLFLKCPGAIHYLWLEHAGHNNIDSTFKNDLFQSLAHFFSKVAHERRGERHFPSSRSRDTLHKRS